MIILMAGLPGTGKTTLARELAHRTKGALLSKDKIRAALFSAGRYRILRRARRLRDGGFSRRYQIDRVLKFARELAQPGTIIECTCSDESARRRLDLEPNPSHPAHNRTFALYHEVKARFEPITYPKTTICTDQPLAQCIEQVLVAVNAS